MRANRVEVAEQNDVPFRICFLHIAEHFFEHGLCFTVRIGAFALGAFFGNRDDGRIAVNRGGRTENEVLATVITHGIQQYERGVHVVLVVFERLGDGFAHSFEACKMDAGVKFIFAKNFVHGNGVTDVGIYKRDGGANEFAHTAERFVA